MIAVPVLEHEGCSAQQAHASSVAMIFVLSLITAIIYGMNGDLDLNVAWDYIPWGAAGAILGALLLKRIKAVVLHRIFGILVCAAAIRSLFT